SDPVHSPSEAELGRAVIINSFTKRKNESSSRDIIFLFVDWSAIHGGGIVLVLFSRSSAFARPVAHTYGGIERGDALRFRSPAASIPARSRGLADARRGNGAH